MTLKPRIKTVPFRILIFLGALIFAAPIALPVAASEEDREAMPEGEHKDLTYAMCSGCHSFKLVAQQGLSYERWDKLLTWMTEEQGMPELDDQTRSNILDYLSEHYNEDR